MIHRSPFPAALLLVGALCLGPMGCSEPASEAPEEAPEASEAATAPAPAPAPVSEDVDKIGADDPRVSEIFDLGRGETAADAEKVVSLALAAPALPAVQLEAFSSLEFLGKKVPDEAVAGCARIMKAAEAPAVRMRGAEALEYIGGRAATDVLLEHLTDPDPDVREGAADALELMVEAGDLERVKAAYDVEVDRQVKLELLDLLENIEMERKRQGDKT